jgi:nicotinamidase-related amidase
MAAKRTSFLKANGEQFLSFLDEWYQDLPIISFKSLLRDHSAEKTAVISVDVINGFCKSGNLFSPRTAAIVSPIAELFRSSRNNGIRDFVLIQDTHPKNSKEFAIYPPHCVEGTAESHTVKELIDLPGSDQFVIIPKKTIHPAVEPRFEEWLSNHSSLRQFLLVGDCTDICIYQTAIFLKSWYIQQNEECHIVVPANCVDTFDIPVEREKENDALPHPAEFLHVLFLYHLRTSGIHVVQQVK